LPDRCETLMIVVVCFISFLFCNERAVGDLVYVGCLGRYTPPAALESLQFICYSVHLHRDRFLSVSMSVKPGVRSTE